MELGLGATPANAEGLRSKARCLAERGWLLLAAPGAFRAGRRSVAVSARTAQGARCEHTGRQGITGLKAATTPTATRLKATASFRTVTGTASSSEMLAAIRFEFRGS